VRRVLIVPAAPVPGPDPAPASTSTFDLDRAWDVHPQVSVRPEPFGALLYHFGTRKLSFLKDRGLLAVVQALSTSPTARAACASVGASDADAARYARALAVLARSSMLVERSPTP
jgi:putative mycofactocin binding protein MftB